MAINNQIVQELLNFLLTKIPWVVLIVKKDVLPAPIGITGGCSWTVVAA